MGRKPHEHCFKLIDSKVTRDTLAAYKNKAIVFKYALYEIAHYECNCGIFLDLIAGPHDGFWLPTVINGKVGEIRYHDTLKDLEGKNLSAIEIVDLISKIAK
jgi:hypothetical protein